jgi:quinol monooxygenase YgiN
MIVVTGRIQVPAEHRERFLAIATEMCRASREDAGCSGYRVYSDLEQADRYVFVEEWEDEAALHAHFAEAHTGSFMAALPGLLGEPADAVFHTVASSRRLDPRRGLLALD